MSGSPSDKKAPADRKAGGSPHDRDEKVSRHPDKMLRPAGDRPAPPRPGYVTKDGRSGGR